MIAPSPATSGIEGRKVRALQGNVLNRMVRDGVPRNAWVRKERKAPQKINRPDPAFGGRRVRVKRRCKRPPVSMVTWIWANPTERARPSKEGRSCPLHSQAKAKESLPGRLLESSGDWGPRWMIIIPRHRRGKQNSAYFLLWQFIYSGMLAGLQAPLIGDFNCSFLVWRKIPRRKASATQYGNTFI
jgi:hypothetical protein